MVRALFTTARVAAAIRSAPAFRNIAIKTTTVPVLRRTYTNTSVYTQGDGMSSEELLQKLLAEQRYLIELLNKDDSNAPWQRQCTETVNREVQEGFHEPQSWTPEDTFRN
ncbi:hypothetical protein IW140_002280 [Coemansia sp. RSA 1813]|nr:hypothetical protein EV178_001789 [Coemansia sp. RSA 1646]KAJ1770897.1 hypothetical protein LPJ74_002793 [Coemansia sp. RSA 1843]KAJ2092898.1 hypothetical protein IW138_000611 [Coemansia sp. RSA 986]KAJ2216219.1 hypothetical protein EV179_001457 [Coemansia sp. RSA 487]KAJ2570608.1 hypothetical protein IW140_002280 [Coemansia sp. RSA 1813]